MTTQQDSQMPAHRHAYHTDDHRCVVCGEYDSQMPEKQERWAVGGSTPVYSATRLYRGRVPKTLEQAAAELNRLETAARVGREAAALMSEMDATIIVLMNLIKDDQPLDEGYRRRIYDGLLTCKVRPFVNALIAAQDQESAGDGA